MKTKLYDIKNCSKKSHQKKFHQKKSHHRKKFSSITVPNEIKNPQTHFYID